MTEYHVSPLAPLQADDGRRAALTAAAAAKCIAGGTDNPELHAAASRIHATLTTIADEMAEIRAAMRVKP